MSAGKSAGGGAWTASEALVEAVGGVVDRGIDRMLLTGDRVASAEEARRLLRGDEETEALAGDIQKVVVLAGPVVRMLARGARFTRVPWVMIASSAVSVGLAVRTGVRELQVLAALVAYRLEEAGGPSDPELVKKAAIDLYLHPKRSPDVSDDTLHVVRLTRKWVVGGALGRKTSKRAEKALAAAERFDAAELAARWAEVRARDPRRPVADEPAAQLPAAGRF